MDEFIYLIIRFGCKKKIYSFFLNINDKYLLNKIMWAQELFND